MIDWILWVTIMILAGGAVSIALLTFEVIRDWFVENRTTLSSAESDTLDVTVKKNLENGNVVYVQGFYDQKKESFVNKRVIKPESVAPDVAARHRDGEMVVYQ